MRLFILNLIFLISTSSYASSLRISPEELSKSLDSNIKIVDVREKNYYLQSHIQGAINFPVSESYLHKNVNGQIAKPEKIQSILRKLGLTTKSNIIIYDDGHLVDAARVFWTFEVYGLKNIKILDHGFDYWTSKKYPVSKNVPTIIPSNYVTTINQKRLSSKFTTQLAIHNNSTIVVDARPHSSYIGETSVAKRFGHILSAINIPFDYNIEKDSDFYKLKPITELKKLYSDIPVDKKIIIYCKIGRVSSTNYFALRELGHDVSNYDASWREWGNDDSLPISK